MQRKQRFDNLDQYDFLLEEYIHKAKKKYAPLIGLFLIEFSSLEHSLNLSVAMGINARTHTLGYSVIESLTTNQRIELFTKLYLALAKRHADTQVFIDFKSIRKRLKEMNQLRNIICHANWFSLDENGYVRSKISTDGEDGSVRFRNDQVLPHTLNAAVKECKNLARDMDDFVSCALSE